MFFSSSVVAHLGFSILGRSIAAILAVIVFIIAFHLYLPIEEKYLADVLGKEYKDYYRKVPRYFRI